MGGSRPWQGVRCPQQTRWPAVRSARPARPTGLVDVAGHRAKDVLDAWALASACHVEMVDEGTQRVRGGRGMPAAH